MFAARLSTCSLCVQVMESTALCVLVFLWHSGPVELRTPQPAVGDLRGVLFDSWLCSCVAERVCRCVRARVTGSFICLCVYVCARARVCVCVCVCRRPARITNFNLVGIGKAARPVRTRCFQRSCLAGACVRPSPGCSSARARCWILRGACGGPLRHAGLSGTGLRKSI